MKYAILIFSPDTAKWDTMSLNDAAKDGFRVIDVAVVRGKIIYTLEKAPPHQNNHYRRGR